MLAVMVKPHRGMLRVFRGICPTASRVACVGFRYVFTPCASSLCCGPARGCQIVSTQHAYIYIYMCVCVCLKKTLEAV